MQEHKTTTLLAVCLFALQACQATSHHINIATSNQGVQHFGFNKPTISKYMGLTMHKCKDVYIIDIHRDVYCITAGMVTEIDRETDGFELHSYPNTGNKLDIVGVSMTQNLITNRVEGCKNGYIVSWEGGAGCHTDNQPEFIFSPNDADLDLNPKDGKIRGMEEQGVLGGSCCPFFSQANKMCEPGYPLCKAVTTVTQNNKNNNCPPVKCYQPACEVAARASMQLLNRSIMKEHESNIQLFLWHFKATIASVPNSCWQASNGSLYCNPIAANDNYGYGTIEPDIPVSYKGKPVINVQRNKGSYVSKRIKDIVMPFDVNGASKMTTFQFNANVAMVSYTVTLSPTGDASMLFDDDYEASSDILTLAAGASTTASYYIV